jgi:hypothetical protein
MRGDMEGHGWVLLYQEQRMAMIGMGMTRLEDFARCYTEAWNSGVPDNVAAHFAPEGSLAVNGGAPATGRASIAELARSFMTAFPDLHLRFDGLEERTSGLAYHWTLRGHYAETGAAVEISGYELWTLDAAGLIERSLGKFDAADYERQIRAGGV